MGTQTMGSEGAGAAQQSQMQSLTRQGSLYSLTLDEIQTQLGNRGKPLGSMNLDELLKSVWTAEGNFQSEPNHVSGMAIDYGCALASSLHRQESLTLSRDLSKKTVDEVWKDIQQKKTSNNQERSKAQERQTTLGEMTLEDFLAKAGVVTESAASGQKNAGPVLEVNSIPASQQNLSQHGQWMQYQLPSVQPHPQQQHQQNLMAVYMPTHSIQQSLPVSANPILDSQYPESQMNMSPSSLMGTLSDTQTPGRKRVAPGGVVEKTVERRQKRMIKNRESAARSRARKQAYTHELENKVSRLEEENERLRRQRAAEILPSVPPPEPKCQLRRTGSAPF
ncbi:ABSCISIC ACID-INSENSITIVE 5-like protein 2 [Melia azedarach]|uniref:ABSCISIC ACID-INSENSITIVE 5-like protein 2 n=2 Tax=Melia azedarach TaxID=155640 RepID=A0ACC1X6P4_MELAZ|nr:ABSCISIC ACID-INSENSITIVE 5-like protein 2 [Melia azedarach]KAJ4706814.1 ABSCISIC ACID-INSENSITIVE 5-like protein 2 [Melia azedarach]